jgi:hypothetical protein
MNTSASNMISAQDEQRFADLLALANGKLDDPKRRAEIRQLIDNDPRWRAHYDSTKFLDLERAAAEHDENDLRDLLESWRSGAAKPTDFCREVAVTNGGVFDSMIRGEPKPGVDLPLLSKSYRLAVLACCGLDIAGDVLAPREYLAPLRETIGHFLDAWAEPGRATALLEAEARAVALAPAARHDYGVEHWEKHLDECVYCRRMRRFAHARFMEEELGEPLLRDRLLKDTLSRLQDGVTLDATRLAEPAKHEKLRVTGRLCAEPRGVVADPKKLLHKPGGFKGKLLKLPAWQFSAAIILTVVVSVAAGAGYVYENWYLALAQQIESHHLNRPVEWAVPGVPVIVAGRNVIVEGRAWAGVIDKVRVTVSPGRDAGKKEKEWTREASIEGKKEQAVPFAIRFEVPKDNDNVVRMVKVELIPNPEARKALPKLFKAEDLTYETRVSCRPRGVIAGYPPGEPAVIETKETRKFGSSDPEWRITVRTRTSSGFVTIAYRDRTVGRYTALPPQPVSEDDQELVFSLRPGTNVSFFSVTTFAAESGSAESLLTAVKQQELAGILVGKAVELPVNSAGEDQ